MAEIKKQGLTIDEKILIAAVSLPESGFTAEMLIIASFKLYPHDFSLMGFPDYPDSNKILTQVTTAGRGLQKRGWLLKIGKKRYQITEEGLRHVKILNPSEKKPSTRPEDRDISDMLERWLRSDAFLKFKTAKKEAINEREALGFWGLSSGASAARTHRMMAVVESSAKLLRENSQLGRDTSIHHNFIINIDDAKQLVGLDEYLRASFREALVFLENQKR